MNALILAKLVDFLKVVRLFPVPVWELAPARSSSRSLSSTCRQVFQLGKVTGRKKLTCDLMTFEFVADSSVISNTIVFIIAMRNVLL